MHFIVDELNDPGSSTIPAYDKSASIQVDPDGTSYVATSWADDGSMSADGIETYNAVDESQYDSSSMNGATNTSATQNIRSKTRSFKVQLECDGQSVVFEASIPISESSSVNYSTYEIVHLPTDIWAYRNTASRRFGITGHLVSRTADEADLNAKYIDLIRSWTKPDFGGTGATPSILRLSGYRNNNIDYIPVLLMSYSVNYADDVDWIFQSKVPMPVICGIQLEFAEAYSPEEITQKFWKTKINETTGMFSYGAAATVGTSGVGAGDSIANGLNIPNISSGNFPGLAAMSGVCKTASNLLGSANKILETPNTAATLGITNSTSVIASNGVQCVNPLISTSNLGTNVNMSAEDLATYQNYRPGETFGREAQLALSRITIV